MVDEQQLNELVERLKQVAGGNLRAVYLYGSAAAQEFHSGFSNINILCLLHQLQATHLAQIAPAVRWWTEKKHAAPLVFSEAEIKRSPDVFAIEMLDIQRDHRTLYGPDIFPDLHVPMDRHHIQLEHELRTKALLLRQHYLSAHGDPQKVWGLMLSSASSFVALFRHALIDLKEQPPRAKRDVVQQLAQRLKFDSSGIVTLLQARESKTDKPPADVQEIFAGYLAAIEKVIEAVDAI